MITNEQIEYMQDQYYDNGIGKKEIRSYEVSLWTLQDEFITVLKWSDVEQKGRIENPKMILDIDGTEEFSFSIPMYYYNHSGEWIANPNWYNVENGNLITSLRKIKVIFNKYEDEEAVYEFLITEVTETHNDNNTLICEVKCEGLAFHELGKIGYKFKLSPDDYTLDLSEWEKSNDKIALEEPINNIDYWCGGKNGLQLTKVSRNDLLPDARKWYYQVDMNWLSFKGAISRDSGKIYEESYATSWDENLHPIVHKNYAEKRRSVSIENSNIYNITQTIAETFGVFCRYQYDHDENYHISGRRIIFYNNFFQEELSSPLSFSYPHSASKISRSMDGKDLTTKLYVLNVENSNSLEGSYTIMNTEANKTMEDYILNFDYLHNIHAITEEQYQEISKYEKQMREYNQKLIPIQYNLEEYRRQKPEIEAKKNIAQNSIPLDQEQIDGNNAKLNALDTADKTEDGFIDATGANSRGGILIEEKGEDEKIRYYVNLRDKGISQDTIKIYNQLPIDGSNPTQLSILEIKIDPETQNPVKVYVDKGNLTLNTVYISYKYSPQLYYNGIITQWQTKKAEDQINLDKCTQELDVITEKIDELEQKQQEILNQKKETVDEFNAIMGPALREGYWQPEDYNNYGDHKNFEKNLTELENWPQLINETRRSDVEMGWDSEVFDNELSLTYKYGINMQEKYYPCINLSFWFTNSKYQNEDITKYSFIYKCNYKENDATEGLGNEAKNVQLFSIGAGAQLCFVRAKNTNKIYPALLLTGAKSLSETEPNNQLPFVKSTSSQAARGYPEFGIYTPDKDSEDNYLTTFTVTKNMPVSNYNTYWTFDGTTIENCEIVYPRIKLTSIGIKTDDNNLILHYNKGNSNILLSQPKDYFINTRSTKYLTDNNEEVYYPEYFITIKPITLMQTPYWATNAESANNQKGTIYVDYVISNANTSIYLDALEVSKENAYPKVSYDIDVNTLFNIGVDAKQQVNYEFSKILYNRLAQLAMINDAELKFQNTFGYISHVELDLDNIVNDTVEIMNYKTKFEDLFSTIVAQTEAMKRASNGVASIMSGSTPLSEQGLTDTITNNYSILDAYLDAHFDSSQVVKDKLTSLFTEAGQILADSSNTLNKMTSLTLENADILSNFALNVEEELTPYVFKQVNKPNEFKVGDIWLQTDKDPDDPTAIIIARYVATANSEDSENGGTAGFVKTSGGTLASIKGATLDIDAEKGNIDILAETNINMVADTGDVNIDAGQNVNIYGEKSVNIGGTIINIGAASTTGTIGSVGGVNIIATHYNEVGSSTTSIDLAKVLIHPSKIEMGSAEIVMRGGQGIKMITSRGDNGSTNAITMDPENGVYIGSGKGIRLFSGTVGVTGETITYKESANGAAINSAIGASVELNNEHLILGYMNTANNQTGNAIELDKDKIVIASGPATVGNADITGVNGTLVGAKFTQNSIGFATSYVENTVTKYNAVLMNDNGITLGSGSVNVTETTANLRNVNDGSYVRLSGKGIELGSLANLYVNMDNFKLQTDNGLGTRLAIGTGLNNICTGKLIDNSDPSSKTEWKGLVYTNGNLYINGNVQASTFTATSDYGKFIANGTQFGLYDTSDNGILTIDNEGITTNGNLTLSAGKILTLTGGSVLINTTTTYGGYFSLVSGNVVIKSNPTNTEGDTNYLKIGGTNNGIENYIKYTTEGKLEIKGDIKADNLSIGGTSAAQYVKNNQNNNFVSPDSLRDTLNDYLLESDAASTYLSQTDASDTYPSYATFQSISSDDNGIGGYIWGSVASAFNHSYMYIQDNGIIFGSQNSSGSLSTNVKITSTAFEVNSDNFNVNSLASSGNVIFQVGNNEGDYMKFVSSNGDTPAYLDIKGSINAIKGQLGGWTIKDNYLTNSGTEANNVFLGTKVNQGLYGETTWVMYAGGDNPENETPHQRDGTRSKSWAPFRLNAQGELYSEILCLGNGPADASRTETVTGHWDDYVGKLWLFIKVGEGQFQWKCIDGTALWEAICSINNTQTTETAAVSHTNPPKDSNNTPRVVPKPSSGCFIAGTRVMLANGTYINIEDLKLGMLVKSYNEQEKTFTSAKVTHLQLLEHKGNIYDIVLSSGKIITMTASHPLLTINGWKSLDKVMSKIEHQIDVEILSIGDLLITENEPVIITQINYRPDLIDEEVYHCKIEPYHTFIIENIVAHNAVVKDN